MIADCAYVRGVGGLPPDVLDGAITPHLAAAAIRLKRWVGPAAYADAASASPADADRAEALKLAEAHLALTVGMPSWAGNLQAGQGFVGGASLAEGQASYLTPAQVRVLSDQHLAEAERLAQPYLLSGGVLAGQRIGVDR